MPHATPQPTRGWCPPPQSFGKCHFQKCLTVGRALNASLRPIPGYSAKGDVLIPMGNGGWEGQRGARGQQQRAQSKDSSPEQGPPASVFSCVHVPATTAHSFDPHLHFLGLLWRRWLCTEPPESSHGSGVLLREGSEGHCMHVPPPHQKRTAGQRDAAGDVLLGQKVTAVRINGNRQHLRKKSPSHVPNAKQRGSSGASELCVPTRQSHEVGTGAGLCVAPCRRGRGGP